MNVFGKETFKVFVVVLDTVMPCSILLGSGTPGNIAGTTNRIVLSSLEQEPTWNPPWNLVSSSGLFPVCIPSLAGY